ncbi:MAG: hypothetical protein Kilf2KO_26740 [Rhodospirillales bacterium]
MSSDDPSTHLSMTHEDAKDFYEAYLAAWNAQDLIATSGFYGEPSCFVLPDRTVPLEDANATLGLLEMVFEGLHREDFERSTYESLTVRSCNPGVAALDVSGIARHRRDGSVIETIDGHYILRHQDDGGWRIAVTVVCKPGWLAT